MGQMQRIGQHQTTVRTEHGITTVRYVHTVVVVFGERSITLRTGGWRTATTKARMNQTANQFGLGFCVYQKNHEWFVYTDAGDTFPFDGDPFVLDRATMQPIAPEEVKKYRPMA